MENKDLGIHPPDLVTGFELEPFFDLSPDLLCIAGYDGYFKRINPAVSKLLGFSNQELMSRPIHEFIYQEDKEITSRHREYLTKSNPLLNFENRYVTKSGEIVWLSWTSMPLDDAQLVYAIAKNITHKKKLEEDRNFLLTNLTKINQELKQLTYTTSHDLRSPVNNLLSVFNLIDISKIQDPETLEFINILKSSTEGLKNTLNSYVDQLSQTEGSNVQIEELNLKDTLEVVSKSIQSLIHHSNATFLINFSEFESLNFNRAFMESIFLNLITNSIKYARPGYPPVISIYSQKVNGIKQLIFSDNGLGFDMEKVKDKIFGFRQHFNHQNESKGIGLYLVYNHITSFGGQITVESKTNEGAKFTLSFKE
ncbi:MAG: PAS domain S-box protein [Chitinophagaceae bacterium]